MQDLAKKMHCLIYESKANMSLVIDCTAKDALFDEFMKPKTQPKVPIKQLKDENGMSEISNPSIGKVEINQ